MLYKKIIEITMRSKKGELIDFDDPILKRFNFDSFMGRETLRAIKYYNFLILRGGSEENTLLLIKSAYHIVVAENISDILKYKKGLL